MGKAGEDPRPRIIPASRKHAPNSSRLLFLQARDEDILAFSSQLSGNRENLSGGLPLSPDYLWEAFPEAPMMIDSRETKVFKGEGFQLVQSLLNRSLS